MISPILTFLLVYSMSIIIIGITPWSFTMHQACTRNFFTYYSNQITRLWGWAQKASIYHSLCIFHVSVPGWSHFLISMFFWGGLENIKTVFRVPVAHRGHKDGWFQLSRLQFLVVPSSPAHSRGFDVVLMRLMIILSFMVSQSRTKN